ncbi:MAG: hypothetical protein ACYTGL_07170 [Planctomycetota bacterium]|jgi:hypothetical protein
MSTVVEAAETEQELVSTARMAISNCNWTVGECAAQWTTRYSRGRTDADFGQMVGLSGDQIYQRRRVWESFADVQSAYPGLKWSHFYVALTWTDSAECLAWANENEATIAEMKAWRRMQNGEDLTVESEAELDMAAIAPGYGDAVVTMTPEQFGESDGAPGTSDSFDESIASANRVDAVSNSNEEGQAEGEAAYAPFRKDAASPPQKEGRPDSQPVGLDPEQAFKRATTAIERCNKMLVEHVLDGFGDLDEKLRIRFLTAVENFNEKVAGLSE